MTVTKIELLDRTLKMPLVQGHPVVLLILLILLEKCWEPLYAVCEVLIIMIRMRAFEKKNAHRASTS